MCKSRNRNIVIANMHSEHSIRVHSTNRSFGRHTHQNIHTSHALHAQHAQKSPLQRQYIHAVSPFALATVAIDVASKLGRQKSPARAFWVPGCCSAWHKRSRLWMPALCSARHQHALLWVPAHRTRDRRLRLSATQHRRKVTAHDTTRSTRADRDTDGWYRTSVSEKTRRFTFKRHQ